MEVLEEQWTTLTAPLTKGERENSDAFRYDFQKIARWGEISDIRVPRVAMVVQEVKNRKF